MAGKLLRAPGPETAHWELTSPFKADSHFTLLALARCEIQAIRQSWSPHRVAISPPDGELEEQVAREVGVSPASREFGQDIIWPKIEPARWGASLRSAIKQELAGDLERVRARQKKSLRRELRRIDSYFDNYERELLGRATRRSGEGAKTKTSDRLAAAKSEHARRRADQLARHEIRVRPRVDSLLLIAETAWRAQLRAERTHHARTTEGLFVLRSRRSRRQHG